MMYSTNDLLDVLRPLARSHRVEIEVDPVSDVLYYVQGGKKWLCCTRQEVEDNSFKALVGPRCVDGLTGEKDG